MRSQLLDTLPREERQLISHALLALGITPLSRQSLDDWARGNLSPRSRFTDWLADAIKSAALTDDDHILDDDTEPPRGFRALLKAYDTALSTTPDIDIPDTALLPPSAADAVSSSPPPVSPPNIPPPNNTDALIVLLPLLIVLSTLLFLLLIFLIFVILLRKRRGIVLRDHDGPLDLSREDIIEGEGGLEGVEQRWLETVSDDVRRDYRRAKEWQTYNPPNSFPTDITLSQFLSIQEKGVSAWSFEPDYLSTSVLIQSRTELTFLSSTDAATSVQSNLPLPKLNEVYYWEVKMFDKPPQTSISVGLATKPYPSFRMPGWAKHSVAYHSDGTKSYNYPFLSSSYGPPLLEGDVLGVGFRPRSGTVFYTRNGKKLEDAFIGLTRHNLFPTIGADGPCTVHVNLGQAGFVYIEANVKKWGLAPGVGTLAPPPAYGAERGSILLASGGGPATPQQQQPTSPPPPHSAASRRHRTRRPHAKPHSISSLPSAPSPLRTSTSSSSAPTHSALSPLHQALSTEEGADGEGASLLRPRSEGDVSDIPEQSGESVGSQSGEDAEGGEEEEEEEEGEEEEEEAQEISEPESEGTPQSPNPPTPNVLDISLHSLARPSSSRPNTRRPSQPQRHARTSSVSSSTTLRSSPQPAPAAAAVAAPGPPAYSPLDAHRYPHGVALDLPTDVIAQALEDGYIRPTGGSRGSRS